MKKNQKKLRARWLTLFALLMCAIIMVPAGVFANGHLDEDGKPQHTKARSDNGNGTYTISLDVMGDADTSSTDAKANILIVYDVSGSMTNNDSHYFSHATGQYGQNSNGNFFNLLYRSGGRYYYVNNNNYSGTVYDSYGDVYTGPRFSYENYTRGAATEKVAYNFADALFEYNKNNSDNVQMALVAFSSERNNAQGGRYYGNVSGNAGNATTAAWLVQDWTNNESTYLNNFSSNGTSTKMRYGGGTNWEAAMTRALSVLSTADSDPTYVVFITDGAPTFHIDGGGGSYTSRADYEDTYEVVNNIENYNTATKSYADPSSSNTELYGIYAFGTESDYLDDVIYYAHNGSARPNSQGGVSGDTVETPYYYNASDNSGLQKAINDIFAAIVKTLGVDSVSIADGTTAGVKAGSQVADLLTVDESSYKYYMDIPVTGSGPYTTTRKDLVSGQDYTITLTETGSGVFTATWTDSAGDHTVGGLKGEVNLGKFRYNWESKNDFYNFNPPEAQLVEKTITDDNGNSSTSKTLEWDLDSVGTLLDGVKYTVTFDVYPSQYTYDTIADLMNAEDQASAYADLPALVKKYLIRKGDNNYILETNTVATLTYTDTRDENPQATTEFYNELDEITTTASELTVNKSWDPIGDATDIKMTVTKDGEDYQDVELNSANIYSETTYISTGLMRVFYEGDSITGIRILDKGHEYAFSELDDNSYEWDLDVKTVRPMLINSSSAISNLVLVEDSSAIETAMGTNDFLQQGDKTYFKISGKVYEWTSDSATGNLYAENTKRSYLTLYKDVEGDVAEDEAFDFKLDVNADFNTHTVSVERAGLFGSSYKFVNKDGIEVTVEKDGDRYIAKHYSNVGTEDEATVVLYGTVDTENMTFTYQEAVWFSMWDYNTNDTVKDLAPEGWTAEEKSTGEKTGYYYAPNGTTLNVAMTAHNNIRFSNVPAGTTYTFEESSMPDNYSYVKAEQTDTTGTVTDSTRTVKGTVKESNENYSVTYTNRYEKRKLTVNKVWDDNDNENENRPSSVSVQLKKNGQNEGDAVTLDSDNDWTYTYKDLDSDATYTVEETVPDLYEASYETKADYTVKATTVPEDAEEITVQLYKGDEAVEGKTLTLTKADGWAGTFEGLEVLDDGSYSVQTTTEGVALGALVESNKVVTITNTEESTEVTVNKTWNDSEYLNNDKVKDYVRPESITLTLTGTVEGETTPVVTRSQAVSAADDGTWSYTFTKLPKKSNGKEVSYTVSENALETATYAYQTTYSPVDGRVPESGAVTVTNTPKSKDDYNPVALDIKKTDSQTTTGAALNGAVFTLYKEDKTTQITSVTVENGVASLSFDEDESTATAPGQGTYYLKETTPPTGYQLNTGEWKIVVDKGDLVEVTYSSGDHIWTWLYDLIFGGTSAQITVVDGRNVLEIEDDPVTTSINATKVWDDNNNQDGLRKNVSFKLQRKVGDGAVEDVTFEEGATNTNPVSISTADGQKATWTSLPVAEDGQAITYSVVEDATALGTDYTVEYGDMTAVTDDDGNITGYTVTITNKHTPEVVTISGEKTWDDADNQDNKRPASITINLLADGEQVDSKTVRVGEDGKWTYSFANKPKYKDNGTEIVYTITEEAVTDYTTRVNGYNVTNTHTPETTTVSGTKTWNDADYAGKTGYTRPESITVNLIAKVDGEEITLDGVATTQTVTAANNWAFSFTGLPVNQPGEVGKAITYSVEETAVDGFEASAGTLTYDIVNTPNTDTEEDVTGNSLTIKKVDALTDGETGISGAEFTLTKEGESEGTVYTTGNDGTVTISFPKGSEGTYTLEETAAPTGYELDSSKTPYTIVVEKDFVKVELQDSGLWRWFYRLIFGEETTAVFDEGTQTITVSDTPELVDVPVTKTWVDANDQDGVRPGSVTFQLYKKVGDADPVAVTDKTIEVSGTRTNNNWNATFKDLPSYEDGKAVEYRVVETNVPDGYTASPTTATGTTITNTHNPATTEFAVNKVWLDGSNADGVRPESVTFQLYKTVDGKKSKVDGKTITVSGTNEVDTWSATFTGLPEKEDGKPITYSVEEVGSVTEYKDPVQTSANTITNPHVLYDKTSAVVKGTKTLVGRAINAGEFEFKIELTKTPDGVNTSRVTVPANVTVKADGSFEFDPIEFKDAGEYEFKVTEVKGSLGGVTYDEHAENIKITVTEMTGDGGQPYLTSSVDYGKNKDGEAKNGVEFKNTYSASGQFQPNGKKTLYGVVEPEEEAAAQDDAATPAEEPAAQDDAVTPKNADEEKADDAVTTAEEPAVEPDAETVSDEAKNGVAEDADSADVDADSENNKDADEIGTTDSDEESDTAELAATVDDSAIKAPAAESARDASSDYQKPEGAEVVPVTVPAGKFTFEIRYLKDGQPYGDAIFTGSNSESGSDNIANVAFSSKTYTTEDLEALVNNGIAVKSVENGKTVYTVNYIVSEKDPKTSAIAKNPATYNITVKFTDDGEGTLTATVDDPNAMFSFDNYYKTENAVVTLTGLKILETVNGTRQLKANEFTFEIKGANGAPEPEETQVKNDANGNVVFGPIKFTKKDLGNTDTKEFTYTISEIDKTDSTIDYSAITDQTVTVVVKETIGEDGKGTLTASIKGLKEGDPMYTFVNKYEPAPETASITDDVEVNKVLEGAALKAGQFEFTFAAADPATEQAITDQKVVMPTAVTKTNAADGTVKFDKVTYKKAGVYSFKITEVIPEDAVAKFTDADGNVSEVAYKDASAEQKAAGGFIKDDIKYDNAEYTVKVTVTDDNEGKLVVSHELVGSETAVFTNVKQHTDLVIKKNLADFVKQTDENGKEIAVTASFAFRITGTYPDGSTYSNVAGLDFTKDSPLDQEVVIKNVPTGLTNVTVTEIYSGNFSPEGDAAKPAVIQQSGDDQYLYKYLVEFKNTHTPNNDDFNHGVTNKYEKGDSGYVHNGN